MNGDDPFVFPPPEVSTIPPPAEKDFDIKDSIYLAGVVALFVFVVCCIVYYIYHLSKKHEDNSKVNGSEEDLEKGNARKVEAVHDKEFTKVKSAKNVKRSANHYDRLKKARYVMKPERIYVCEGDLESGEFDERCSSSDDEFFEVKSKRELKVDKDETKSISSEGDGDSSESGDETIHNRRSKEVKSAKDTTSNVASEGGQHSGSSDKRVTKSKNGPTRNGKAKNGRSAGAGESK